MTQRIFQTKTFSQSQGSDVLVHGRVISGELGWASLIKSDPQSLSFRGSAAHEKVSPEIVIALEDQTRLTITLPKGRLSSILLPNHEATSLGFFLRRSPLCALLLAQPSWWRFYHLRGASLQPGDVVALWGQVSKVSFLSDEAANREAATQYVSGLEARMLAVGASSRGQLDEVMARDGFPDEPLRSPAWLWCLRNIHWFVLGAIFLRDFASRGLSLAPFLALTHLISAALFWRQLWAGIGFFGYLSASFIVSLSFGLMNLWFSLTLYPELAAVPKGDDVVLLLGVAPLFLEIFTMSFSYHEYKRENLPDLKFAYGVNFMFCFLRFFGCLALVQS